MAYFRDSKAGVNVNKHVRVLNKKTVLSRQMSSVGREGSYTGRNRSRGPMTKAHANNTGVSVIMKKNSRIYKGR